jgi:hypothetical protein
MLCALLKHCRFHVISLTNKCSRQWTSSFYLLLVWKSCIVMLSFQSVVVAISLQSHRHTKPCIHQEYRTGGWLLPETFDFFLSFDSSSEFGWSKSQEIWWCLWINTGALGFCWEGTEVVWQQLRRLGIQESDENHQVFGNIKQAMGTLAKQR